MKRTKMDELLEATKVALVTIGLDEMYEACFDGGDIDTVAINERQSDYKATVLTISLGEESIEARFDHPHGKYQTEQFRPAFQVTALIYNPGQCSGPPENCEPPSTDLEDVGTTYNPCDATKLAVKYLVDHHLNEALFSLAMGWTSEDEQIAERAQWIENLAQTLNAGEDDG